MKTIKLESKMLKSGLVILMEEKKDELLTNSSEIHFYKEEESQRRMSEQKPGDAKSGDQNMIKRHIANVIRQTHLKI